MKAWFADDSMDWKQYLRWFTFVGLVDLDAGPASMVVNIRTL